LAEDLVSDASQNHRRYVDIKLIRESSIGDCFLKKVCRESVFFAKKFRVQFFIHFFYRSIVHCFKLTLRALDLPLAIGLEWSLFALAPQLARQADSTRLLLLGPTLGGSFVPRLAPRLDLLIEPQVCCANR
jgi:hypothetical protein